MAEFSPSGSVTDRIPVSQVNT